MTPEKLQQAVTLNYKIEKASLAIEQINVWLTKDSSRLSVSIQSHELSINAEDTSLILETLLALKKQYLKDLHIELDKL